MTDEQIKYMVGRFLMWRLPEHFNPDCGISFDQKYRSAHGPVGANLFDATQANEMVRHMIEGMPAAALVAEGMALVPVETSDELYKAVCNNGFVGDRSCFDSDYALIISAAGASDADK